MRKLKPIPELASLSEAQLETLNTWLGEHPYSKVVELVAKPAPEGFGIQISRDKLYRHYHRLQAVAEFQDHRELVEEIDGLKLGLQASRSEDICLDLIIKKAFDLALRDDHTPKTLKSLFQIVTFRKTCELAEQRAQIAKQKVGLAPTQTANPPERSADILVRQNAQSSPNPQTAPASPSTGDTPALILPQPLANDARFIPTPTVMEPPSGFINAAEILAKMKTLGHTAPAPSARPTLAKAA